MASALAAVRATDVLRYLAAHPDEIVTHKLLTDRLEVSGSAMHSVLDALVTSGLVDRSGRVYRLGPQSHVLGSAARSQNADVARSMALAETIATNLDVAVAVCARRGDDVVVLDVRSNQRHSDQPIAGLQLGFAAPNGASFVADAPPQDVLAWITRGGIDPEGDQGRALKEALKVSAARGWVVTAHGQDIASPTLIGACGATSDVALRSIGFRCDGADQKLALNVYGFDGLTAWAAITATAERVNAILETNTAA